MEERAGFLLQLLRRNRGFNARKFANRIGVDFDDYIDLENKCDREVSEHEFSFAIDAIDYIVQAKEGRRVKEFGLAYIGAICGKDVARTLFSRQK